MQNCLWRGTQELIPGKAHWEIGATKITVTTSYSGPYEICQSQRPVLGQAVVGFDYGLRLTGAELIELDGGAGQLNLTLEAPQDPSTFSTEVIGAPTYEIEWAELNKPLETHPRCGILKPGRTANTALGKVVTWEDWQFFTADDYDGTHGNGGVLEGSIWSLAEYQTLKNKGIDSYNVGAPVIRRTSCYLNKPGDVGAAVDRLQDPPSAANFTNITGYQWLGGVDRCTKQKRLYTRSTEWIGAQLWEPMIYRNA